MNRKAVREQQRFALGQVRRDVLFVSRGLLRVRQRDQDHIRAPNGFGGGHHFKALFLRDRDGFAALVKADDDLATAVFEVERVGVALRAEAEHGQGFVFEHAQVRVFVRINFCRHGFSVLS